MPVSSMSFTKEERRKLLDEYFALERSLVDCDFMGRRFKANSEDARRIARHEQIYMPRIWDLLGDYIAGVPFLKLSRCPISGAEVEHSLDNFGLDGLWWKYFGSARPLEGLPPAYFAFTGALKLVEPVEHTSFLALPGPEVPYVIPRLLKESSVTAVISSVSVGVHNGYAIFYFARPIPRVPRANDWGANEYKVYDAGSEGWDEISEDEKEFDFDLSKWITSGRLQWIAPGDTALRLRTDVSGCPYLNLPGRRTISRIQYGEVRI
jgi:hypothetical protein